MGATRNTVRVKGLRRLQNANAALASHIGVDLKDELRELAEPVKGTAETLARGSIRNVGVEWSTMRVGVTKKAVYVAPKKRSSRVASRKRKNFGKLLLDRSLVPALDLHADEIRRKSEALVGKTLDRWGRVG